MSPANQPRPITPLPTMYELPSEDPEEPGLPDEFHDFQPKLLRETCKPNLDLVPEFFIGADLNLYYDTRHPLWYKRPDWFLVLDVPAARQQEDLRLSYVMWEEGTAPFLVIELLSPGTEDEDLGQKLREINKPPLKWEVYERILRVPFYVVYDRYTNHLRLFGLERGRYQPIDLLESRYWFEPLGLGLGVWQGRYQGAEGRWLRWYDAANHWILTETEARQQAEQQAQQEVEARQQAQQQAEQERQRADAAEAELARLRALVQQAGIEVD